MSDLFSPVKINGIRVKNRIVMAPMGNHLQAEDGSVTEELLDYYRARARGDAGLIISPFSSITSGFPTLGVYTDELIPGLEELAQAMKDSGSKAMLQIAHFGGKFESKNYAPSAIESPIYPEVPEEMTKEVINDFIERFVRAGLRAREAGFDGVEVHGAHTYLIGQFISPHTNRRSDEYGGSFEDRMRFPRKIVKGIRERVGDDFAIGFKFSAHENLPNGVDGPLSRKIASHMEDAGVDYIHVATTSSTLENQEYYEYPSVPSLYSSQATLIELAEDIKKNVQIPVIGTGGITDPEVARDVLREGKADLIALGRALIADPSWPEEVKGDERVTPCIRCNVCHLKEVFEEKPVRCTVNPKAGLERDYELESAETRKQVDVVGSGPAGMEAALVAARRGHDVSLFEKNDSPGGMMIPASKPDFKKDISRLFDYYLWKLDQTEDLEVKTGEKVDKEKLLTRAPDEIIIATGAVPREIEVAGLSKVNYRTGVEAFGSEDELDSPVLIVGAGRVGSELAWYLSDQGTKVTLADVLPEADLLPEEHPTNRAKLLHSVKNSGVETLFDSKLKRIEDGLAKFDRNDSREEVEFKYLVISVGMKPRSSLSTELREEEDVSASKIHEIGDCVEPADFYEAVHDGHEVGLKV